MIPYIIFIPLCCSPNIWLKFLCQNPFALTYIIVIYSRILVTSPQRLLSAYSFRYLSIKNEGLAHNDISVSHDMQYHNMLLAILFNEGNKNYHISLYIYFKDTSYVTILFFFQCTPISDVQYNRYYRQRKFFFLYTRYSFVCPLLRIVPYEMSRLWQIRDPSRYWWSKRQLKVLNNNIDNSHLYINKAERCSILQKFWN